MAKQLNLLATGQVIPTALHAEMQRSYLEYAMSVIVGRALPDVRDGLKPVHRRILYAMHELGLTPDRPYRKCARVVGDVLGKYHPHGDQSVYDALVRLVQEFSSRYPLLAGHGNFGSVDNDPPAAMRYTETRLAAIGNEALLSEIGEATVDFIGNFDNSQQEPTVLPAQLPILLLNGSSGIAVGMATNIPPHNLGEVVDGLVALIDQPDLADEKLWKLIPGPDFPTGGEIVETSGIREAYSTGKGSIPVQGVVQMEEVVGGRGRHRRTAIVITELPFQVNKAAWIEKVAELVNQGRIEGIADLRDESDREGMRVVVELKRDANPQNVLDQLTRQTALRSNFGAILLALVDGQPRQLTLRQMLEEFLKFREQTLTRQYSDELDQAQRRIHLVEGLLAALSNLDAVIDILRNAPDGSTAKLRFQSQFNFSDTQADAILSMPMRRLTGLERQNLQAEFDELSNRIEVLQRLLSDRNELLKALKKDLRALKRKYADPRRTKIAVSKRQSRAKEVVETPPSELVETPASTQKSKVRANTKLTPTEKLKTEAKNSSPQILIPSEAEIKEEVVVEFTQRGYVRRLSKNGAKTASQKVSDDFAIATQLVDTQAELMVITSGGKVYAIKVRDIPPTPSISKGTPLVSLLPSAFHTASETIITQFFVPDVAEANGLVLFTQRGQVKRLQLSELANISGRGLTLIKLKDNDELAYASLTKERQEVVLATSGGRLLRFLVNDQQLPVMGRTAQGLQALRLGRAEHLVGAASLDRGDNILLVSQLGYAKRLPVTALRLANRGDIGTQALQFTTKTDSLAGMVPLAAEAEVVLLTSTQRLVRLSVDAVALWGKDGIGDRISQLKPDEKIINVRQLG
ncbi:MAG TPA: DNA topoisomerase (ATP-hydrolyzing) [Candidatus Obscuribacterales bacterium]